LPLTIAPFNDNLYRFKDGIAGKGKKVERGFHLPADLNKKLTRHCKERNQLPSSLVRDLLSDYLEKNKV